MIIQTEQNNMPASIRALDQQNRAYHGSSGISQKHRNYGFKPAFLDEITGSVYLARYADGRIAPMHTIDSLPDELIVDRNDDENVVTTRANVIAGFIRDGLFYTRDQAEKAVSYFNMYADLVSAGIIR